MSNRLSRPSCGLGPPAERSEGDVVELPLLLPRRQLAALESAAHQSGVTAAALLRLLLRHFLAGLPPRAPDGTVPAEAV